MKKFIAEKYADDILVLAHKYINENPQEKDSETFYWMGKILETMDKYWAYINRMDFMMHVESIQVMTEYAESLGCTEIAEYLENL